MSASSFVLIIIPTYNRGRMLPEAIESSLGQDYPYKRLVVVDDGSSDDTKTICDGYLKRFPGDVLYVFKPNGGCASARNTGLEFIDEDIGYVCFLDSDDRFLPGKLSREVELLLSNPNADFVYGDSIIHDECTGSEYRSRVAAAGRPGKFALLHFFTNEAKSSALLYRVNTVRHRRFREDLLYNEDSEFLQRVAIECSGVYSPEPGCWIRWHKNSKSRNYVEIYKAVLRASVDILDSHPDFYRSHRWRANRRIRQIRSHLVRELVLNDNWAEAREYAKSPWKRLFLPYLSHYYRLLRRAGFR